MRPTVGDKVRYTASAERELRPPVGGATGEVIEDEDTRLLVRWSFSEQHKPLAWEYPKHIRRA